MPNPNQYPPPQRQAAPPKAPSINLNTALIAVFNIALLIIAFFARHELERIELTQNKLWESMMPRHEIEVQLQAIRADYLRLIGEQQEFRVKQSKFELDLARMTKP